MPVFKVEFQLFSGLKSRCSLVTVLQEVLMVIHLVLLPVSRQEFVSMSAYLSETEWDAHVV